MTEDGAPGSNFVGEHARSYADSAPRKVPGLADLHRMTSMLLAERIASDARILVLGAGGGLEIKALADAHSGWRFDGVDPSADMLRTAEQITAGHAARIRFHEGYIEAAPAGPFDGAVCLLTLHFMPRDQRLQTLRQIKRRLKPNAPFVAAHISFPQNEPERSQWIARHVAFGGADPAQAEAARQGIATRLPVLTPEEDEALFREAGLTDVSLFYAVLSFRGWVSYG
jgi:tRNA (cmo5U34)-methyltransferase